MYLDAVRSSGECPERRRARALASWLACLVFAASAADAHHSFVGFYDQNQVGP